MDESRALAPAVARELIVRLYTAAGVPEASAAVVADHLVDSSLAGLHSHGVLRAPDYLDHADAGLLDVAAEPSLLRDDGAVAVLDAARCFGQVAGRRAAVEAVERASAHGVAVVTVAKAAHLGRIGAYVEHVAREGHLCIAFCSVPARYHNVAWFGAREGRLGTNPLAYAFPTGGDPVVADFSTSAVPEGRIRFLRNQGLAVPDGVLRDAEGRPTRDPSALYADPPGALQPLGGAQGHKGSALGMLVEAMATLLAGEHADDPARDNNLTLVAIRPQDGFTTLAGGFVAYVRSAAPLDADRPVMVPGEPEQRARASATAVVVDPSTWKRLALRAAALGVEMPPDG